MSKQSISVLALTVALTNTVSACRFVTLAGAHASAAGNAVGVSRTEGVSGDVVPVDVLGTTTVEAGGPFGQFDPVEVGANGTAVEWGAGVIVGRALNAASAAGDMVEVLLISN